MVLNRTDGALLVPMVPMVRSGGAMRAAAE
jgi:hypothetical protein